MENLDDMIRQYAEALEAMGQSYGGEAEIREKQEVNLPQKKQNEGASEEVASYSEKDENGENTPETAEITAENGTFEEGAYVDTEPAAEAGTAEPEASEVTSTASFSAAVFSGEGTYPVKGARVVVYRDDNIYAFLETDGNGATKKVTLPAFPEENSLEPQNPDRSIDYYADVFAEGFITQKGLLVSGVGGSEIFLRVLMIPEAERIG